ncbi:MAG: Holliday junction resolvase Hjc [Candidatus Methanomethylicia archaeon]|nr:Holliday junction resolvase Hjc [Candidatus Methanomethylicia archaeon]
MGKAGAEVRRKGFAHERELAKRLYEEGFAVIRAPASGSKLKRIFYPDVVAIYKGKTLVFEVKAYSKLDYVYLEEEKIKRIVDFSERAGGRSFIAVKIIGSGEWRVIPVTELERTKKGYYSLKISKIEKAQLLEDLIKKVKSDVND